MTWDGPGITEADTAEELRCPGCGEQPGAASKANEERGGKWHMDFCEECGLWADEGGGPPLDDIDFGIEAPEDPYAHREEMRELHEAQV